MAAITVRPSYQFSETDIVTVDKLNLIATPIVDLAVETPVNDQNYFRNGNFYSSFWTTPAGVPVPPSTTVWTGNANYWLAQSAAGTPTYLRSAAVPDLFSLFSAQLMGASGVGAVSFGQQINGDLSATLRRPCTFSGYMENTTGQVMSPTLQFWTCNAFNNFSAVTLQTTINLQTCANAAWTFVSATQDISLLTNAANGLFVVVVIPAGSLAATTQTVNFSRLKFQIGEIATEFSDDPGLFIQTPSIDSTMLQDGCIARPTLFLPSVIPSGAFVAGAIHGGDIAANTITAANLSTTAVTGSLGYTPVNKAGDSGVGVVGFTTDTVVSNTGQPGIVISSTAPNVTNNNIDPALGFSRPGTTPIARYIGLAPTRRFRTVDDTNKIGYLLDTITGVDTASYQDASITLAKLAQSLINIVIPAGMIRMFAGVSPPIGWLLCDGAAYSQSAYPTLYAAIGTYWGAGSGGLQFQVPDLRGRSPLGYVSSPVSGGLISARSFASTGGEENHALSASELASHSHGVTDSKHNHTSPAHGHAFADHTHNHTTPSGPVQAGTGALGLGPTGLPGTNLTTSSGAGITFTAEAVTINPAPSNITINNFGSNAGHNNMSPFAVVYFIIKT